MPTTSQIPEAEDALQALIAARPLITNEEVPVELGYPIRLPQDDHIYIGGDIDDWDQDNLTTDPDDEETFTFEVIIFARRSTDDWKDVRDRAFALRDEVTEAVRADRRLQNTVYDSNVRGGRRIEELEDTKRVCILVLKVACRVLLQ